VLGDQDAAVPFPQRLSQGGVHRFVKLAFHAGTIISNDCLWAADSSFHEDPAFLGEYE
jgi:hypothetical protein